MSTEAKFCLSFKAGVIISEINDLKGDVHVKVVRSEVERVVTGRHLLQSGSNTQETQVSPADASQLTQEDICFLQGFVQKFSDNSCAPHLVLVYFKFSCRFLQFRDEETRQAVLLCDHLKKHTQVIDRERH